jgi:small GTP-binding protein
MFDSFDYDVFICHSASDAAQALPIADHLRADGLRVWLAAWEVQAGEHYSSKIESGLTRSRVLILCTSINAFGPRWPRMEACTVQFRDPRNPQRRLVVLRLDKTPLKAELAHYPFIDAGDKNAHSQLMSACRQLSSVDSPPPIEADRIFIPVRAKARTYAFSSKESLVLTALDNHCVQIFDLKIRRLIGILKGHEAPINCVSISPDRRFALTGSDDRTIRYWDLRSQSCVYKLEHHRSSIRSVAFDRSGRQALSVAAHDPTILRWDLRSGSCKAMLEGHRGEIEGVIGGPYSHVALSGGGKDHSLRLWDLKSGACLKVFKGHTDRVRCVTLSSDQEYALSGSNDKTVRLWNVRDGRCISILEGHVAPIIGVGFHPDHDAAFSVSASEVIVWDLRMNHEISKYVPTNKAVCGCGWSSDGGNLYVGFDGGEIEIQDYKWINAEARKSPDPDSHSASDSPDFKYTNAKVVLIGESGSGKTGLSKRLTGQPWQPTDSTVGAWATQWPLPDSQSDHGNREIWLWDFGGQADQRLIHQLYMDDASVAVHVFDGQRANLFETLSQWDRDFSCKAHDGIAKLLVAGRIDASVVRASRKALEDFRKQHGYLDLLETSAKTGVGCEELRQHIQKAIRWENIPWQSSPPLFKRLKQEIIKLKDQGVMLMRFNELRETLRARLFEQPFAFKDDELKAAVSLLSGPGLIWELKFGGWILFRPELINAYAQAVIQTLRDDPLERGCVSEERVFKGDLVYTASTPPLHRDSARRMNGLYCCPCTKPC